MTTPEQRLFAAQQVYPDINWEMHQGMEVGYKHIAVWENERIKKIFDPKNNAEQRWDMVELVWDSGTMIYKKDGYYVIPLPPQRIINKSIDEALILAVCALGGFDETK